MYLLSKSNFYKTLKVCLQGDKAKLKECRGVIFKIADSCLTSYLTLESCFQNMSDVICVKKKLYMKLQKATDYKNALFILSEPQDLLNFLKSCNANILSLDIASDHIVLSSGSKQSEFAISFLNPKSHDFISVPSSQCIYDYISNAFFKQLIALKFYDKYSYLSNCGILYFSDSTIIIKNQSMANCIYDYNNNYCEPFGVSYSDLICALHCFSKLVSMKVCPDHIYLYDDETVVKIPRKPYVNFSCFISSWNVSKGLLIPSPEPLLHSSLICDAAADCSYSELIFSEKDKGVSKVYVNRNLAIHTLHRLIAGYEKASSIYSGIIYNGNCYSLYSNTIQSQAPLGFCSSVNKIFRVNLKYLLQALSVLTTDTIIWSTCNGLHLLTDDELLLNQVLFYGQTIDLNLKVLLDNYLNQNKT